ncbi:hypothetical protein PDENDC454_12060 [Paenibacillus dendritiformis C454]|uniref:Uncharacterized protein n=1 Tax=Paenibacillus dendritiformis C454 TaxID=1131935 RepID=H3SFV7_9BACL|nr:hypothetical protein PDENDC454_12060 [Paenibacillus dendritiformis C454]
MLMNRSNPQTLAFSGLFSLQIKLLTIALFKFAGRLAWFDIFLIERFSIRDQKRVCHAVPVIFIFIVMP